MGPRSPIRGAVQVGFLFLLLFGGGFGSLCAQDPAPREDGGGRGAASASVDRTLDPAAQLELIIKAFHFDRELLARQARETSMVIGLLYLPGDPQSETWHQATREAATQVRNPINWTPLRLTSLPYQNQRGLHETLVEKSVDLLLVGPLGEGPLLATIREARAHRVPTATGQLGYVEEGVCVGAFQREEPSTLHPGERTIRRRIKVNRPACEAAGVEFPSDLLKLAVVVREGGGGR